MRVLCLYTGMLAWYVINTFDELVLSIVMDNLTDG